MKNTLSKILSISIIVIIILSVSCSSRSKNSTGQSVSKPIAPTNLSAIASGGQVSLSWSASTGATSYNIYQSSASGGSYTEINSTSDVSYTVTGLTNGMTYYFVVTAVNSAGESGYSNPAGATLISGAPTNLTATAGNTQVSLVWNATIGVTSYNVYTSTTSGGSYTKAGITTTTSYTVTGLNNGTIYYFVVTAINTAGESGYSNQASATPIPPPYLPANLVATPANAQVALSWSASISATSYNVYESTISGGPYTKVGNTSNINYTVTGLTNFTLYYFVVTAVNSAGESGYSNEASATPQSISYPPANLTTNPGNAQATLSWNSSLGAVSYNIYYSMTSGGPYTMIFSNITGISYTVTGLANCTQYYFVVTAVNGLGESGYSNEASVMPQIIPPAPNNLAATNPINGEVSLSWVNTSACTSSYNVYESTVSGGPYTSIGSVATTNYTVTGLTNNTTYYFVITAIDSVGESGYSNESSATPRVLLTFSLSASPYRIAIDALGNIWVTNYNSNSVTKLSPTGSLIGTYLVGANPWGIAIDIFGSGNVWITNYGGNNVTELSPTGSLITTATVGTNPMGIAIDAYSNIWIANNGSNNVTELNSDGIIIGTYGLGSFLGYPNQKPVGIAIDGYGNVWVATNQQSTATYGDVVSLSPTGSIIGMTGWGHVLNPWDITIDKNKQIWVTDGYYGSSGFGFYGLNFKIIGYFYGIINTNSCIATDSSGNVWMTSGNNVIKLNSSGVIIGTYAVGSGPKGIAIDSSGNVWVANPGSNSINEIVNATQGPQFFPFPYAPSISLNFSDGQAALNWSESIGATGYNVYTSTTSGGPYTKIGFTTTTAYSITDFSNGLPYNLSANPANCGVALSWSEPTSASSLYYVVTAFNALNEGWSSNEVNPVGYNVYTSTTSGGPYYKTAFTSTTSYTITGLKNTYYYVVTALDGTGETGYSNEVRSATERCYAVGTNPYGIAVDASGNVWIANWGGSSISELTYASNYVSANTFSVGSGPEVITIDASGNVWVTNDSNYQGNTVSELTYISNYTTANTFSVGSGPAGIALDFTGNVWVVNQGGNTVSEITYASNYTTANTFAVGTVPLGIAIDASGNVWVTNSGGGGPPVFTVTKLSSSGSNLGTYSTIGSPLGIAIDPYGNVWVANNWCGSGTVCDLNKENSISEFNSTGSIVGTYTVGLRPWGVAIDASGNIWVVNDVDGTVTELNPSGSAIATYPVGSAPTGIAIDASGNVWVENWGDGSVTEIIGVATGPQYFPCQYSPTNGCPQFQGGGNW